MRIEMLADYQCTVGEGPLWHPDERRIYWTDIETGRLFWFNVDTNEHRQCYQGSRVGGMTLQADGSLLLFRDHGNIVVWRDGEIMRTLVDKIEGHEENRFNDVFADVEGRVYCGTLGKAPGRLYRLDRDGSLHKLLDGIGCANGMGHTLDLKGLYFTDSKAKTIYQFDYDRATGEITNQRPAVKVPEGQGVPDGMTVDAEGRLWSAQWGGRRVTCWKPDGSLDHVLEIPEAHAVSCPLFGGDDCRDLYITTAGGEDKEKNGPMAGCLLRVRGAGQGQPENRSRVGL